MATWIKVLIGVGAFVVLFGVLSVGCIAGINNDCVRAETGLDAQLDQNKNNYANFFNKVKEMAQVPSMYAGDLEKLYGTTMRARYGEGGSKAMFQFIQEHNPQLDASMYKQIQQAIEAGRDSFMADQKTLLDKKRAYQNQLGVWPASFFVRSMGYPRVDLAKYAIVINEETEKAFESKKAGPINIR